MFHIMKKMSTRLRVLEMATEIAAEAAQNTNVVWMLEFQEELIERLYRKMISLLDEEEPESEEDKDDDDKEKEKENEGSEG
jgi:hypothetical protein